METKKWLITDETERLDKAISKLDSSLSRMTIQRLIEEDKILVNGKKQKPSYILKQGDIVTLEKEEVKETELKAEQIPLDVVYEDDDIIVINKPKGLVVHPRKWESRWNISKCYFSTL